MSEKIQEQISAFLDGELPGGEAELLVHRLSRDDAMRRKALAYQVIGAAMRNELLRPNPHGLRRRILRALDGEPVTPPTSATPTRWNHRRLSRPLMGLAVATSVAVVAIFSLQNVARQGGDGAPTPQVANVNQTAAPSYVVPRGSVDAGLVQVPIRLTNYLVNHGEYATGLGRKSIQSDIVGYRPNADTGEDAADRESP